MRNWLTLMVVASALAGCTTHHSPPVVAAIALVDVGAGPPPPPGATPGMLVPQQRADGSFPTPNEGLTGVAAIWHLRAGLNVAALSCPGEAGAAIRTGYNAWLKRDRTPLARAQTNYAARYRGLPTGGSYDQAMTRLYNFYAQTPVRTDFCVVAADIVAQMPTLAAAALPSFAESRLALLDQPFTDFYRAYAAWRDGGAPQIVIATAAPTPPTPFASTAPAVAARRPALTLDLSALPADDVVTVASR